jgi:leucine-rich repeat protein SHOC2
MKYIISLFLLIRSMTTSMAQDDIRRGEIGYDYSRGLSLDNRPIEYTSLEEALKKPDQVIVLSLDLDKYNAFPLNIYKLKNLEKLKLFSIKETMLPEGIGNLVYLQDLYLEGQKLEKLPDDFYKLSKLRMLEIKGKLIELPPRFGECPELLELKLERNEITKLPESFYKLNKVIIINLEHNKLTELPSNMGDGLNSLRFFNIAFNFIKVLPSSMAKIPQLTEFTFYNNKVVEVPFFFKDSKSIKKIEMTMNPMKDEDVATFRKSLPETKIGFWD